MCLELRSCRCLIRINIIDVAINSNIFSIHCVTECLAEFRKHARGASCKQMGQIFYMFFHLLVSQWNFLFLITSHLAGHPVMRLRCAAITGRPLFGG